MVDKRITKARVAAIRDMAGDCEAYQEKGAEASRFAARHDFEGLDVQAIEAEVARERPFVKR